jgi:hypothetical protein
MEAIQKTKGSRLRKLQESNKCRQLFAWHPDDDKKTIFATETHNHEIKLWSVVPVRKKDHLFGFFVNEKPLISYNH